MAVRVGIIGAGTMGGDHARILAAGEAGGRLAAIQDADRGRAEAVAHACGGARVHAQARDLIEDAAIDAVLIASPDETHASLAIACIAAGKPVLVEKPLAATLESCRQVMEAEMRSGRRLVQVGFMRRFDPGYRAMRQGRIAATLGPALFLHCRHRNAIAPAYITSDLMITNAAVHEIDIARFVLDDEIAAVTVLGARASGRAPSRRPQLLVLQTAQGVLIDIEVLLDAGYGYDVQAELVCENGAMALAPNPPLALRHAGTAGFSVDADWRSRFAEAYRAQMRAWVASVGGGRAVGASAWDGYIAALTAETCLQARRTGARTETPAEPLPPFYAPPGE